MATLKQTAQALPRLRWPPGLFLGLLCGLLLLTLQLGGALRPFEGALLDQQFRNRGPRPADPHIAVVAVDDATVKGTSWPVPRRVYARLIDLLSAAGAQTIAVDVLFPEPSSRLEDDAMLLAACRKAGNVVQSVAFQVALDPREELPANLQDSGLSSRFAVNAPVGEGQRAAWAVSPLEDLSAAAPAVGHVNVYPDYGGGLREVPLLLTYRGETYPALSLAAVAAYRGIKPHAITADEGGIQLGDQHIALEPGGVRLIDWIGGNHSYPTYSADQLLDHPSPEILAGLKGKVVFIGITALGAFERRATPFSTNQPVVEVQANAADDILSGRSLRPAPFAAEVIAILLLPILCSLLTARSSTYGALAALLVAALSWEASVLLLVHDWYLPMASPLLAMALAIGATAATGFRHEWDINARSEASVVALARGATLMGATLTMSGRDLERLKLVIRATAGETVGGREVFLVLDPMTPSLRGAAPLSPLDTLAQYAMQTGQTMFWPEIQSARSKKARAGKLKRLRAAGGPSEEGGELETELFRQAELWARGGQEGNGLAAPARRGWGVPTLLVAPLPRPQRDPSMEVEVDLMDKVQYFGAIVVAGSRSGREFTLRDAALLEAVADQAALALENWEYGALLRGRVEVANRDLRQAYGLLAEQSAKLFAAVDSIEAAIVLADEEGRAAFVNPAGARVLRGATPILGESVRDALFAGDLDELAALFEDSRLIGPAVDRVRLETVRGQDILSAQFTPLVSDSGRHLGAMLVVADVTLQRELDRMKTDFVGFIAHELRNPLTTILGYASLMDQNAHRLGPEQMREMTTVISRHCRRMNRLITDLLDISRLEGGQTLAVQHQIFDLAEVCERMIAETASQLNPRPVIELDFVRPPGPVEIAGDPERLEQVLTNLLSNAVKYSPDGGIISLSLEPAGEVVHLEVRDTGMGMTAEQLTKLFSKFYRAPEASERGIKGTGLGLHLVRQLVEAHGGQIDVDSVPGQGTRFLVTLPVGTVVR